MAVVNFCPQKRQSKGAMRSVINYVLQPHKTGTQTGQHFISGINCSPQTAFTEFQTTKQLYKKTDGIIFYHLVQSFHPEDNLSIAEFHELGRKLAEERFEGYEVLVATHVDTNHIHNHFVINSVSHETGKKLHHNRESLMEHRKVSDRLCEEHNISVLPETTSKQKSKKMTPKEYRAFINGDSWKLELIRSIENALSYAKDKEEYIALMEQEGYQVKWNNNRKNITYTCPNGKKCRDNKLHDDTYLKGNMEFLFAYRKEYGFTAGEYEPEKMWLTQADYMNPNAPKLTEEELELRSQQRDKYLELIEENSYEQYQDFGISY